MLFGLFNRKDINKGVEEWRNTEGAVLLDVRTPEEYQERSIKGSVNIPLDALQNIGNTVPDKSTPLYVHCRSGGRSASATAILKSNGYTNVHDIGGILSYKGN